MVHAWDGPDGTRWRGGVVLAVDDDVAMVCILAEVGSPLTYRGPANQLQARTPIVCRMVGDWPYVIGEIRPGQWASTTDAWRAAQGEAGVYGIVPDGLQGVTRLPRSRAMTSNETWPDGENRCSDVPTL